MKNQKAYLHALQRTYKAAAFDMDGTLTHLTKNSIPYSLINQLGHLSSQVPVAICTGRELGHVVSKLNHICDHMDGRQLGKKWYLFCENGGVGYEFDCATRTANPLFEIPWPVNVIGAQTLSAFIKDKLGWHVTIVTRNHSIVVYYPKVFYLFPKFVKKISAKMHVQLEAIFKKMGLDEVLLVKDSGIGNIIIPVISGKGKSIERWAEMLNLKLKDIAVVGDQAGSGQNDEEFLSGDYGTAFTVGRATSKEQPFCVYNEQGRKLWGPEGTLHLIKTLKFSLP